MLLYRLREVDCIKIGNSDQPCHIHRQHNDLAVSPQIFGIDQIAVAYS